MKRIVCEMCGGSNLQKEEGVFVCKDCGCKYTTDEAKKLMVDDGNDNGDNGSVQSVNDTKLNNLYERARKSLEIDDLQHAAEYFKQILDEDPNDWEAYFYSYLGEFTSFTNAQAGTVAEKLSRTIPPAYDMAIADCEVSEAVERVKTITDKTTARLYGIASTGVALLRQYEGGNILTPSGKVHYDLYNKIRPLAVNTIANCVLAFGSIEDKIAEIINGDNGITMDAIKDSVLSMRKVRYSIADLTFRPTDSINERLIKPELIHEYAQKIHELDNSFEVPSIESKTNASGGCYVATAIYGSYDCPEVWTLRRYRDYYLAESWYGRAFIRAYYAISPTLVKLFGHTNWFKKMWRDKLDKMVKKLQDRGVESAPYIDRKW